MTVLGYDVISTGYPELDRLIGYQQIAIGEPEVVAERSGVATITCQRIRDTREPLGFPVGRISIVEGPEVPGGWAETLGCPLWTSADGDLQELAKMVQLKRPRVVVIAGELEVPLDLREFQRVLREVKTALVFVIPAGVQVKNLKFWAALRLKWDRGGVLVLKNAISAKQGHAMMWPPVPGELDVLEAGWAITSEGDCPV